MTINRRIVTILFEEVRSGDARCEGYHQELLAAITDILNDERQHRIHSTNIQQKINDKCEATGRWLAEQRQRQRESGR